MPVHTAQRMWNICISMRSEDRKKTSLFIINNVWKYRVVVVCRLVVVLFHFFRFLLIFCVFSSFLFEDDREKQTVNWAQYHNIVLQTHSKRCTSFNTAGPHIEMMQTTTTTTTHYSSCCCCFFETFCSYFYGAFFALLLRHHQHFNIINFVVGFPWLVLVMYIYATNLFLYMCSTLAVCIWYICSPSQNHIILKIR